MAITKCFVILCVAIAATHGFALGPTQIRFHLFTRNNPTQSQNLLPTPGSIATSSFQIMSPTIISIHDHGDNVSGNFNAYVQRAHLGADDVNFVAVDWSIGASTTYAFSLSNTPQVGAVVAQFVNVLQNSFGYDVGRVRIVGVGLGAHAAGIAARRITGTVPHIVALDPALLGWTHHPEILNRDDAGIVEVLHTSPGYYGYDFPLGDIDFYANGGLQPYCGNDVACSNALAYIYYAESITAESENGQRFVGTACENYESAVQSVCTGERDVIFGGSAVKTGGSGIYWFATNNQEPFARG
ncbi:unnamed protein product [Euphydryas editha]|uniref:Lipase domain-containing protein n=1 Tax=Euphydryas editha TaxID=104508 RepID=A0AAU9UTR0_EUPED|nr:unnamed protein product [Euphydryas editha]